MILAAIICFVAACLLSMLLTVSIRHVAPRIGLLDRPDGQRKLHSRAVPLGGGVAVFAATGLVLVAILVLPNPWNLALEQDWIDVLGFFLGCGSVVALGLVDDRFGLRGRHKLLGQLLAAAILIASGLVIRGFGLFGWDIDLDWMAIPVTMFWLVGAMNAINLLDGIDGLAATLGVILALTLAAMAAIGNHPAVAVIAVVFAGSLLGFLRFNFPPASIFLGDAGSMLIGLMIGALAIRSSLKGAGTVILAAPLAALTIPVLDSAAAIIRRKLTGRSVYSTDRAHLHHRLLDALGTNRKVLAVVALACAATSAGALISAATKSDSVALLAAAGVVSTFAITGWFGRGEMKLLANRFRRATASFAHPFKPRPNGVLQMTVRLQGTEQWDLLWENLTTTANRLNLDRLHLDVNIPSLHESYNATWDRPFSDSRDERWEIDFPLIVLGRSVGRLAVSGRSNGEGSSQHIDQIRELIRPLENRLLVLTEVGDSENSEQSELVAVGAVTPTANGNGQGKSGRGNGRAGAEPLPHGPVAAHLRHMAT
ncbi:MAG: undecaprenyl/decaprenyl-phosphate alpha-N-acetylglucosaminyl 1-phosphate transferase [Thermoguttaceae bacterium]|nr:undecaprenyl/decaprenyl-phosphate alpha-N-acetylglucosaminyl 1-phosphate transferase [Thermoguttaceae bacterium]